LHVSVGPSLAQLVAGPTTHCPPAAVQSCGVAYDGDELHPSATSPSTASTVDETVRAILEALMASGNYKYQSDFARRYVAQGKAEGRAEGEAAGRAHALLAVLSARGLDVPQDVRARIVAWCELARLDAWLARAVTATSAAEVVRA
jgi:hypothetical protein